MGKVIVVTSGKGGTGKTTSVGAIASCLAVLGGRTLCIDCDAGLRNLDISLGMADYTVADFSDILENRLTLDDACSAHPSIENLFFLSAPAAAAPGLADSEAMAKLVSEIRGRFDYCLIDSPAGLGEGFKLACAAADTAVIVVTADLSSVRNAQRAAQELRSAGNISEIRLLVNRIRPGDFKHTGMTVDDMIDTTGAQLIGIICEDEDVPRAANSEKPLVLYSPGRAAKQFLNVARRISGEDIPLSIS